MDSILEKRLSSIAKQIEILEKVEKDFLTLDAHKDVLYSEMFRKSMGKTQADKESAVYDSEVWITFSKCLAEQHASFNKERRNYELKLKAFDAEYLTYKVNNQAIVRGVGSQ